MDVADGFHVSVFQDSTTASTSTQRLTGSLKGPNKPSLDTLFSNTWLLEEKNGENKIDFFSDCVQIPPREGVCT